MGFWGRLFGIDTADPLTEAYARIDTLETQIREGVFDSGYDPDANLSASGGGSAYFRKLSDRVDRDFDQMTQERALAMAAWLYESNPAAKRILETVRDYVLGDGAVIRAQDDDEGVKDAVQEAIDRFWDDPVNNLDMWSQDLVRELGTYGELILTTAVNPVDGAVRLGYIDPSVVDDVLLDRTDNRTPLVVVVKRPGSVTERDYYRIIHADMNPQSKTFGRYVGVQEDEPALVIGGQAVTFAGACFLFRVNAPTGAKRGRSDLLCLADWVDALDQHLFGEIERGALTKNFVWDVTEQGATEEALAAKQKKISAPKPGSVRYHNEKVTWQAVTPDLKTHDAQIMSDELKAYIALGAGVSKAWMNATMDVNRATASDLSEPAIKHLTQRQRHVRYMIDSLVRYALDQAELAGRLPIPRKQAGTVYPKPWSFAVQMPEIRPKDQGTAATAFGSMVNALTVALADHAIDIETYQELVVLMAGQFGVEVNLETMRSNIDKAVAEMERKMAMAPYNDGAPGQGQQDKEPARQEQPA